ncbi:MAG: hypothetical protein ACT6FF_05345 [Methanosarcinaceae archaeon]
MSNNTPAQNIDDAYHACHPELPLEADDNRYIRLTDVRGGLDLATVICRRIRRTQAPVYHKQLITGHRGCGKSTELKQLQARLRQEKYFAIYIDIESTLDIGDLNYLDVLVAITRSAIEATHQEKIKINAMLMKNLENWFTERILTEEDKLDVKTSVKAEASVEAKIPFLMKIMAAISGQIQSGSSRKLTLRRKFEQNLSQFILHVNEIIDNINAQLLKKKWHGLVLIIDGMEKMHYHEREDGQSSHSVLFVEHAEQLKAPHCSLIYTVPISLLFNRNLGDSFSDTDVIPMVKTQLMPGEKPYPEGVNALQDLIQRRVNLAAVFENPPDIEELIKFSGGSVRDLLRLLRFTCDETDTKISTAHVQSAIRRMAINYDKLIQEDDLELLHKIDETHLLPQDEKTARLLYLRVVLEYQNHKRWPGLHPAVYLSPRFNK